MNDPIDSGEPIQPPEPVETSGGQKRAESVALTVGKAGEGLRTHPLSDDLLTVQARGFSSQDLHSAAIWVLVREKERQVQELREDLAAAENTLGELREKLSEANKKNGRLAKKVAVLAERLRGIADQRRWRAFAGGVGLALVGLAGNLFAGQTQWLAWLLLFSGAALFVGSVLFRVPPSGQVSE